MSDLLTTKQLQNILQVDRTTIYRMADAGKLPAVKVGNQWRFPRQQIEAWLQSQQATMPLSFPQAPAADAAASPQHHLELDQIFPLECVQLIQDSFADILGVMILVTDINGHPVTQPSNPCGFYLAVEESPAAQKRCTELWTQMAHEPTLTPRFQPSHLGLLCARGLIPVANEIRAMLVLGGIAPPDWPPPLPELERIAADLDVPLATLKKHVHEVHRLSPAAQAKTLPFVQRIADIFAHIAKERHELFSRLQRIAQISQI